jgi:hypothetical protein
MSKNLYISGVGGWLGFLIVVLMIINPLLGFGSLSNEFHDALELFPQLENNTQLKNYKQVAWLILAALASTSFAAGYRLWKIHCPESVSFAILAIWLVGPLGHVLYMIFIGGYLDIIFTATHFSSNVRGHIIDKMFTDTIFSVMAAGIWTAYLMRSVRVKNTYKIPSI